MSTESTTKTYNSVEAKKAQQAYWDKTNSPDFAPCDGKCYRCKKDIYSQIEQASGNKTGISVEEAASKLITGCPHCNYSYCN